MLNIKRGLVLLSGALVLSGCEILITPDRVEEGSLATITVANDANTFGDRCVDEEVRVFYFDPDTTDRVDLGTTTAVGSAWSIDVTAPADRGAYEIQAECDSLGSPLEAEELIVEPAFAPTASPDQYVVGSGPDTITVTGDYCITSSLAFGPDLVALAEHEGPAPLPFPTVTGLLGAEEQSVAATVHQPFDETWELEFAAPSTPGLHQIELACTFFDYASGAVNLNISIPSVPGGEVTALDSHEPADLPQDITEEVTASLLAVQVDGILELDSTEVDEGDSVTATNADSSPCAGTVTVQLLDGETVVDSAAPAVAEDGTWSATFDDLAAGAYSVVAECIGTEEAGNFSYEPVVLSVAGVQPTTTTTTTTTTVPSGKVAADSATPVRTQPAFTG